MLPNIQKLLDSDSLEDIILGLNLATNITNNVDWYKLKRDLLSRLANLALHYWKIGDYNKSKKISGETAEITIIYYDPSY